MEIKIKVKDDNLKRVGLGICLLVVMFFAIYFLFAIEIAGTPLLFWFFMAFVLGILVSIVGYFVVWEGGKLLAEKLLGIETWRK